MFRTRPARVALMVAMMMACGCACPGERVGLFDRLRMRVARPCCETAVVGSGLFHQPCPTCDGGPLLVGDGFTTGGCDTCDGPFLGSPTGPDFPYDGIPPAPPGAYGDQLNIPQPLPVPGIEETPPGEARPTPADGASARRDLGKVANGSTQ